MEKHSNSQLSKIKERVLDYTGKSSTFAYNCLSYIFMLISLCIKQKNAGKIWKLDVFHAYVMRGTQNNRSRKSILLTASSTAADMLFHFNFAVNFFQSSNPFLFNQHKQLSFAIFDELVLSGALLRYLTENNTRRDNFNNSCRGTSVTQYKRSQCHADN